MLTEDQAETVLGLNSAYDTDSLRDAYRLMVRRVHPDLAGEHERAAAEESLRTVVEAYQLLSRKTMQASAVVVSSPKCEPSEVILDNDDHEVTASIVSLVAAVALFGAGMYVVTTHIVPRGISQSATVYSFMGLFVLWGALYCWLVPVMESAAKRRITKQNERIHS